MLHGYKIAAVCVTKIQEETIRHYISSLNKSLTPHGWRVFIYTTTSDLFQKTQSNVGDQAIFDLIPDTPIDAAILFTDKIMDEACCERIYQQVMKKNIPVILIEGNKPDCYNLHFDFVNGFEQVIRHLTDHHGIRKFHYMSGIQGNEFSEERQRVMQRIMDEKSIPFDETMVSYGDFWSTPTKAATEKLIASGNMPEAIVCANDVMAITACSTLLEHGYQVPQDVIVTGFDGIDAIRYSAPKITSCMCCYEALGAETAKLILETEEKGIQPRDVYVKPKIIISESCGCLPINSLDAVDYINALEDTFNRYTNEELKLNETFAKMQSCRSVEEITDSIDFRLFYDMCCLLKTECTDPTLNPLTIHSSSTFGDQLYVLMDTDVQEQIEKRIIPAAEVIPRLPDVLSHGNPLIFTSLHAVDIPLGYLCFHFANTDKPNYLKISQSASYLSMAIGGFRNVQHHRYLTSVVEDLYQYDALTGLYNRNRFLRRYQQTVDDGKFEHLTLVLCDLDGLKYINDTFSHHEGDNAISVVAEALRSVCREGLCCRYGGDELIAVLPDAAEPTAIRTRILDYLHTYNQWAKKPYAVSASIGVYTTTSTDFETMFASADALMYQDKIGKKHRRK